MPAEFNGLSNPHRRDDGIVETQYTGIDDVSMYGVKASITAVHREGRGSLIRGSPATHEATLMLAFDTTYEGYERQPIDEQNPPATFGRSQDPDKIRVSRELVQALVRQLSELGYYCKDGGTLLILHVNDKGGSPIERLGQVYKWLQEVGAACEVGKQPLGNIMPAKGKARYNTEGQLPSDLPDRWQDTVEPVDDMATRIATLARRHFPEGTRVAGKDHADFDTAVHTLFDRGRDPR